MSSTMNGRITRLEDRLGTQQCGTCFGWPQRVVGIPDGADLDDPAYEPRPCPECGRAPRNVLRIIGMTDEELA